MHWESLVYSCDSFSIINVLQNLVPQNIFLFINIYQTDIQRWQIHTISKILTPILKPQIICIMSGGEASVSTTNAARLEKKVPSKAGTCNWWCRNHQSAAFALTSLLEDTYICSYAHVYVLRHRNCGKAECIEDTALTSFSKHWHETTLK